jgi:hypothetical protein
VSVVETVLKVVQWKSSADPAVPAKVVRSVFQQELELAQQVKLLFLSLDHHLLKVVVELVSVAEIQELAVRAVQ